ncbi:MAG TPA: tRNA pseudouridine(13) synthase TruD [Steroidobacteraceae bacterium]|nr:tRNA pseudouridine(13) synthase TruD [Steroidobacteraceae bacterium]
MPQAEGSGRAAALAPPRAYGAPPAAGILRAQAEDFVVEEDLGFAPAGAGEHLLLRVRKHAANTPWVAQQLARHAGCRAAEVGYAGLKDRRAIAVQWFSVPRGGAAAAAWCGVRGAEFEVLEAHAHHRKLPRGALAGNRFRVRIRVAGGDGAGLAALLGPRLEAIARGGVPNYFGPQRFGRDGANLERAAAAPAGLRRAQRGFMLSAARSLVFNAVLAERVAAASWRTMLPGDLANLDGRGSIFAVDEADATIAARGERQEIHPTGPLWGVGSPASHGAVLELELRTAAQFATECALCAGAGMRQERRSLRIAVRELQCETAAESVWLGFRLARGCFATAVLRELVAADELNAG